MTGQSPIRGRHIIMLTTNKRRSPPTTGHRDMKEYCTRSEAMAGVFQVCSTRHLPEPGARDRLSLTLFVYVPCFSFLDNPFSYLNYIHGLLSLGSSLAPHFPLIRSRRRRLLKRLLLRSFQSLDVLYDLNKHGTRSDYDSRRHKRTQFRRQCCCAPIEDSEKSLPCYLHRISNVCRG
jgi:hypothetical protein